MMQTAVSFIAFMATFTVVVLVHELGHFIAARRSGAKVYEFSIGFPFSPRICTFFRHKETEFTLRLLPLGGFVSFSKEGTADEAKALFEISPFRRAVIMAAGSISNIVFALAIFIPVFMIGKHLHFSDALILSAKSVWAMLSGTVMFLVNAVSGNGTLEGMSGPVGIAAMAGRAAAKGALNLLYFSGVLSLSLGIMNLIPFPALDGGQLLMILVESVRKKPFSPRTYQVATLAGLAVFALLTVAVTYKDIVRLIA
jgi:regulator of sigma E protease